MGRSGVWNGKTLSKAEKRSLISWIKKGYSRLKCNQNLMEKYGRTVDPRNLSRFARQEKLTFKATNELDFSTKELASVRGLWLIGAPQRRLALEAGKRTLNSVQKKITRLRATGAVADGLREEIKEELRAGKSSASIAKKHNIAVKFIDEFKETEKSSTIEIENLKRWENTDIEDLLDFIEDGQKRLKKMDAEQGEANIKISTTSKYVALMFLSDIHLENVNTDLRGLRRDFDIIKSTKDFYVGFGGDLIDNFIVGPHKEGVIEAVIPPKAARIAAGKLFDSIRERLLWTILGCHDAWDRDYADYNLPEHIARKLKIPYLGHGGDINLTVHNKKSKKEQLYNIHARHKYRGSSGLTNGTACCKNVLRNIDPKFDIVAISHNHFAEIKIEHYLRKDRVFIRTGSYKKEDRFSNMLGFEACEFDSQIPVVILNTATKDMKVISGVSNASDTLKALNR